MPSYPYALLFPEAKVSETKSDPPNPIKGKGLQIKSSNSPAKPHVKPQNQLTQYPSTTSALHGSYLPPATIELER
jgi:hypothetical protein